MTTVTIITELKEKFEKKTPKSPIITMELEKKTEYGSPKSPEVKLIEHNEYSRP